MNIVQVDTTDVNEVIEALGITSDSAAWESRKVLDSDDSSEVEAYRLVVDHEGNHVAINSDTYDFIPPVEAFSPSDAAIEALGMRYKKAGFLNGRRQIFVEAEGEDEEIKSWEDAKIGDPIKKVFRFRDSFDTSTAHEGWAGLVRKICHNGMVSFDKTAGFKIRHTPSAAERLQKAISSITGIEQYFVKVKETLGDFIAAPVTDKQVEEVISGLFGGESKQAIRVREEVTTLFDRGIGTEGKTKYDLLNAVTQYVNHEATYKETEGKSRDENKFTANAFGHAARLGDRALNLIAAL